jgi:hypothetical protein
MRTRITSLFLSTLLIAPVTMFAVGCDREIAHEEKTVSTPEGTKHEETTVKEKDDGTVVKETEKKVDTNPDRR